MAVMGGGLRTGHVPTRLLTAGMAASALLFALATTAVAAHGRPPAPPVPVLHRVPAPEPIPEGVVTPVPSRPQPKGRTKVVRAARPTVPPTTTTTAAPQPPPPPAKPVTPDGKGMWIWKPDKSDGGNVAVIVARAKAAGLTHIYVRTGSTWDGFDGGPFLDQLLPAAHAAGLKVYGWDFPKLVSVPDDVARAVAAVAHAAPGGHRLDGFAADIETKSEGTELTPQAALAYGPALRQAVGPSYLLIAVVPNPTPQMLQKFPYELVVPSFDVIAPMVYWLNREPGYDVAAALEYLSRYTKPVMPIGQAYDGGPEGGRPGVPTRAELIRFMDVAKHFGAVAVSFWSWQHANPPAWDAIRDGPSFLRPPDQPAPGG
jgi:hypothetical protein